MKRRELEANLTSIRTEMSANDRFKTAAEHLQDSIAKVGFQKRRFCHFRDDMISNDRQTLHRINLI